MSRFLHWLFPAHYSPLVKCAQCGCQIARQRAVGDGTRHFCPHGCEDDYIKETQW